ncbi:MAG TPA: L-arabinose isomerase [Bryobacteraceae bacterium]|nr:L-arabinose isomerase [Bryobacteraceae bacterium]
MNALAFLGLRENLTAMIDLSGKEVWFVTGSQHLYGDATLQTVAEHSREIVSGLNASRAIPLAVVPKAVLTTPEAVAGMCGEANAATSCAGIVTWMHTFSPAKMWLGGLRALVKPVVHLHTQYNRDLPWNSIDMDFMNLNQSAHGDREFGHLAMRIGLRRKIVVGHWQDPDVESQLGSWSRAAAGWQESRQLKIARFGDNMRDVAVTEGDKVEAQARLGYSVSGYGVGDLLCAIDRASDAEADELVAEYDDRYCMAPALRPGGERRQSLKEAAKIELGMRAFLQDGNFGAFTDTFQDLHGLPQLPGIAVQRLMADGYGFGAEGDWKTAALVRTMKVMAHGLPGGTSFMEDYTYDFAGPARVLGAHMLEICPSIAASRPSAEIHPLSIGNRPDPVRLVFTGSAGHAVNASLIQVRDRFRMIVNEIDVIDPPEPLPRLPVARAVWVPRPNLKTAAAAWLYAGGAHHTAFSQAITTETLEDFAVMADIEFLSIGATTDLHQFRNELRWNDVAYLLRH